jgi:hypothetical protein
VSRSPVERVVCSAPHAEAFARKEAMGAASRIVELAAARAGRLGLCAVLVLCAASSALVLGCNRHGRGTTTLARLEVRTGSGRVRVESPSTTTTCRGTCAFEMPRGTRVHLELDWPEGGRLHHDERQVSVRGDTLVVAEWQDRSGQRTVGGVLLAVALGGAVALVVGGAVVISSDDGSGSAASIAGDFAGGFLLGIGGVLTLVGVIQAGFNLSARDHPRLRQRPPGWMAPPVP